MKGLDEMKIYMYGIGYDNGHFKPKMVVNCNIEEVEILRYEHTELYYFRYKDILHVSRVVGDLKVCCGLWELNGGLGFFCSLRKLTSNEIDKIRNIYFKREGFVF